MKKLILFLLLALSLDVSALTYLGSSDYQLCAYNYMNVEQCAGYNETLTIGDGSYFLELHGVGYSDPTEAVLDYTHVFWSAGIVIVILMFLFVLAKEFVK